MKTPVKILLILAVVAAAAAAVILKSNKSPMPNDARAPTVFAATNQSGPAPVATVKLPKLLDLGATRCVPCKMMIPVLDSLKQEYAGRLNVEFIDVWENPDAAKTYGITIIPTQIFYDADGKELVRHEGFFARDDILAKWKELGVNLARP